MPSSNPAALREPRSEWADEAALYLGEVASAMAGLRGAEAASYDHIGSTSVPGLAAKPFIDLQVRILPLPSHGDLAPRLAPLGYSEALGARPDSPGVTHDIPFGDEDVAVEVWEKRLYVSRARSIVLHIRRGDSPWGSYTVWFRDWLREFPAARQQYEGVKRKLSAENEGKPDYDDYTRAKSMFFREVYPQFRAWATSRQSGPA